MANDVSAFIWENIEEVETVEELTKMICEEFEVSFEEALRDTEEMVTEMKKAGWIE